MACSRDGGGLEQALCVVEVEQGVVFVFVFAGALFCQFSER